MICVLMISVLHFSMYFFAEDICFTSFYVFVCWGYRFYLFLCICVLRVSVLHFSMICVLRISALPLSMYLCFEDIGFTSFYDLCVEDIGFTFFYVFFCWGYLFYLFLCICLLRISVLPSATQKYIERGKTDILNKQLHRNR
jgi:hypothetical protein